MFAFLRKARKSLVASNNIRKYFLYAIGEVLLVMIGILLALQVNNWNEKQKEKSKEKVVLREFSESLQTDLQRLNAMVRRHKKADSDFFDILYYIDHALPYHDSLDLKYRWLTQAHSMKFNRSAFTNLENKGLNIIRDSDIKEEIIFIYEDFHPRFEESLQNYEANIHQYSRPIIRKHFHTNTTSEENFYVLHNYSPIDFELLKEMPEFRNILITLKHSTKHQINLAEGAIKGISDLLKEIDLYLV